MIRIILTGDERDKKLGLPPEEMHEMIKKRIQLITKKNSSGIYAIRNIITNELYIGSSARLYKRQTEHLEMLKEGEHHSYKLQASFNEYGRDAFEFLFLTHSTFHDLKKTEQIYLDMYEPEFNVSKIA